MLKTINTNGTLKTTVDAVSALSFLNGGFAYKSDGSLHVVVAGATLTNPFYVGGMATTAGGALYITFDTPSASSVMNGGLLCRNDGAVHVNVASGYFAGGLPVSALGEIFIDSTDVAEFYAPRTSSITQTRGSGTPTETRATVATVMGYGPTAVLADGQTLLTVASGELRFQGGRRISEGVWSDVDANGVPIPAATRDGSVVEAAATNRCLYSKAITTGGTAGKWISSASGAETVNAFTTGANWSYGAGVLTGAGLADSSTAIEDTPCTAGKTYRVSFDYNTTSGLFQVRLGTAVFLDTIGGTTGSKVYTAIAADAAALRFANSSSYNGTVSNISVKEAAIQMTANSVAAPDGTTTATTLTAGEANATLIQDLGTVASAAKSGGLWIKRKTGTGNIDLTFDGGSTWTTQTGISSTDWTRFEINQTLANEDFGIRIVTSGDAVYVSDAMVVTAPYLSSDITTTSAAATRNKDVLDDLVAGNLTAAAGSVAFQFTPLHAPSGTIALCGSYVDANNYTALLHDATKYIWRKRIASVNYDAELTATFASGTTYDIALKWGASGTQIAVDGVLGTANTTGIEGVQYGKLPGTAGAYFSTPDSVANSITGDIDIRVKAASTDWTPVDYKRLVNGLNNVGQFKYSLLLDTGSTGKLFSQFSVDGTATVTALSSVGTGFADGAIGWVRVTRASTTGTVKFYTSSDGSAWTQLGTDIATAAGAIFNGTDPIWIGSSVAGGQEFAGTIYRAQIYNTIGGTTPVVDFNPGDYTHGTTWTSSTTGEVYTINGDAAVWPAAKLGTRWQWGADGNGGQQAGAAIKEKYLWTRALSDSELQAITA